MIDRHLIERAEELIADAAMELGLVTIHLDKEREQAAAESLQAARTALREALARLALAS